MNWIISSILMMLSSIVYYVIIRYAQRQGIPNKAYMFANFSIPAFFFYWFATSQNQSITIPLVFIGLIFIQSFFLSYLGSVVSFKAIQNAPNAGYSLVIQKSYAVYTSIAAIFLFGSELSLIKFIAIGLVLISSAVLSIPPSISKIKKVNFLWVFLSFIAFFCYGTSALVTKYIYMQGIPSAVILFWITFFVSLFSLIDLAVHRAEVRFSLKTTRHYVLLFLIGFSVTFFYYFKQVSEVTAPNIGYVGAMNTASNGIYTLVIAYLFKEHLTWKKLATVIAIIVGILVIIL